MNIKLYHGSPQKTDVLKPYLAHGIGAFQNQKAVFFTKSFEQAALYAIGKSLKGKTPFALPPGKLIIVGDFIPERGYVYEVELPEEEVSSGELGDYEFAYTKEISKFKIHEINPEDYMDKIIHVSSKEEMIKMVDVRNG